MNLLRETDTTLLGTAALTAILGITTIYSATFHTEAVSTPLYAKQLRFAIFAVIVALAVVYIPNKLLYGIAYPLYLSSFGMLLAVLMWGTGEDVKRWLTFGLVTVQPSELAKITTIIALARYLGDRSGDEINLARTVLGGTCLTLIPVALVARQPDLGTAVSLGAVLLPMLYWAGMRPLYIFCMVSPLLSVVFSFEEVWRVATPFVFGAFIILSTAAIHFLLSRLWFTVSMATANLSAGLITVYLWDQMRAYQKARILTFLNPESDPQNTGWTIIQSKIAIGSGGLSGKGFLEGTQTRFEFLPEAHTDLIFSVIGEELGFIGALVALSLFLFLICRALYIGYVAKNRFFSLLAIGLASMLTFHVFVNVGMTIGVMPVTGLPLPFLSYGGSSLLANFTAIGLLLHVYSNRHEY